MRWRRRRSVVRTSCMTVFVLMLCGQMVCLPVNHAAFRSVDDCQSLARHASGSDDSPNDDGKYPIVGHGADGKGLWYQCVARKLGPDEAVPP